MDSIHQIYPKKDFFDRLLKVRRIQRNVTEATDEITIGQHGQEAILLLEVSVELRLAIEILSLCLQFESQIQFDLHDRQDRSKISDQTFANQNRFKLGCDDFVVYPRAFPAFPAFPALPNTKDDIWAFASLGENLRSCPNTAVPDMYWHTLRLQNDLAQRQLVAQSKPSDLANHVHCDHLVPPA